MKQLRGEAACVGVIVALNLLINVLVAAATTPGANLAQAADGSSWYDPAVALLQYGALVDPADPTQPQTYRPPLFLIFAAAAMWLAGGASAAAIVVAQLLVLLATGLVVRQIARERLGGWGNTALALTIFNPNALANAHLVQSDTLFAFFVALALWATLAYGGNASRPRHALLSGVFLGLACLVRPTPQFLLLLLPLVFATLGALAGGRRGAWRGALGGTGATALGLLVVLPWAVQLASAGHGLELTTPAIRYRFVWDQVQTIDAQFHGTDVNTAARRLEGPDGLVERFTAAQGAGWMALPEPERWRRLTNLGYRTLAGYPLSAHIKAALRSVAQFLLAPGSGNWHGLFGVGAGEMSRAWFASDQSTPLSIVRTFFASASPAALAVSTLCLGILVALRLLGVAGVVGLLAKRDWPLLLVLAGVIAYFALVHAYVGTSRYRLSVEPALVLLAVAGISTLAARRTSRAPAPSNVEAA